MASRRDICQSRGLDGPRLGLSLARQHAPCCLIAFSSVLTRSWKQEAYRKQTVPEGEARGRQGGGKVASLRGSLSRLEVKCDMLCLEERKNGEFSRNLVPEVKLSQLFCAKLQEVQRSEVNVKTTHVHHVFISDSISLRHYNKWFTTASCF